MKYKVFRTETADAQIRKLILYVAENFGKEVALEKLEALEQKNEEKREVTIYSVADQRQGYLNIIRGL